MPNPKVIAVRPLPNHRLELRFANGELRVFDATPYLDRGVFVALADDGRFAQAQVVAGSIEWPGEIDLSYDTLYLDSAPDAAASRSVA